MPEAGFPNTYNNEPQPAADGGIRPDVGVIKSMYGYIKITEILMDLLGFICVISNYFATSSRGSWYNFVVMAGFWYSGLMLILYVFHVNEKLTWMPWKKVEFVLCCVWTIFHLIASALAASVGIEAFSAAAFFGFVAMVAFAWDAWMSFGYIRPIMTVRTTTTTTTVQSPTTY